MRVNFVCVAIALLIFSGTACHNSSTSPSTTSTSTTTTTATPTNTELFIGVVPVGGAAFYSFNIGVSGVVNVTLNSVSGALVPPTVQLGLGIGQPAGNDCTTTSTITAAAGTSPQLTGTFGPGIFCVRVYDVGNLFGPAGFNVTIAHF